MLRQKWIFQKNQYFIRNKRISCIIGHGHTEYCLLELMLVVSHFCFLFLFFLLHSIMNVCVQEIEMKRATCGCVENIVMTLNSFYGEQTKGLHSLNVNVLIVLCYLHLLWHTTLLSVRVISAWDRKKRIHHAHCTGIQYATSYRLFQGHRKCHSHFYCGLLNHLRTAKTNHIYVHAMVSNKPPKMHHTCLDVRVCVLNKWRKTCKDKENETKHVVQEKRRKKN